MACNCGSNRFKQLSVCMGCGTSYTADPSDVIEADWSEYSEPVVSNRGIELIKKALEKM